MSISSCPRCAKQVTLPVDVDDRATVRCPLCHAQFPLSEALVNAPPLLEVIEHLAEDVPADSLEAPSEPVAVEDHDLELAAAGAMEPLDELDADPEAPTVGSNEMKAIDLPGEPAAEAVKAEHDDVGMQDHDTEVEDFDFDAADSPQAAFSPEAEPIDVAGPDDNVLGFDEPTAAGEHAEIDFGDAMEAAESANSEDNTIDFDSYREPAGADMTADFVAPRGAAEPTEDMTIDFGETQTISESDALINFDEHVVDAPADDGSIVPDFGEPAGEAAAAMEVPEEPAGKKGKNKKKKKPAEAKADGKPARKRSLVGTIAKTVLPLFITVPAVLYGGLWLGNDYDVFGIRPWLPSWVPLPKTATTIARATVPPQMLPTQPATQPPSLPSLGATNDNLAPPTLAPAEPAAEAPATEPDAVGPVAGEPAKVQPGAEPTLKPPSTAPSESPVEPAADDPLAIDPPKPSADDALGDAKPAEGPDLVSKPAADDQPEEMPDKSPLAPASAPDDLDNLLGDDKPTTKPAPEELPPEPAAEVPQEPAEELGPREAATFSPADLAKGIQDASLAFQKMTAAQASKDEARLKTARKDFYLRLYETANMAALIKGDAAPDELDAQRQTLEQLSMALAADPKRLGALGANGARWLEFPRRTTPGIVLAGTVQEVEHAGKLYLVRVQLGTAADAPVATVACKDDPRLEPLDEALTLGSIVENPDQQLAGYDGIEPEVIWSGMTLKLPAGK